MKANQSGEIGRYPSSRLANQKQAIISHSSRGMKRLVNGMLTSKILLQMKILTGQKEVIIIMKYLPITIWVTKLNLVPNSDYCSCTKGENGSIQNEPKQPML